MANFLNPIITEAINKGISVKLVKNGYVFSDFYKLGEVQLVTDPTNENALIVNIKKETIKINNFADLVKFHYQCWLNSKDKKDKKLPMPSKEWLDDYIKLGLVTKQIVYTPKDVF